MDTTLYKRYRSEMGTGDLIQWRSNTALGFTIRMLSKSDVNHSSIIVRPYNRVMLLEALEGGVYPRLISDRLKKFKGHVYWCPLKDAFSAYSWPIGYEAFGLVGTGYDFKNLFKQAIMRVSTEASKLFCSETVYVALSRAKVPIPNPPKHAPQPGDIESLGVWNPRITL